MTDWPVSATRSQWFVLAGTRGSVQYFRLWQHIQLLQRWRRSIRETLAHPSTPEASLTRVWRCWCERQWFRGRGCCDGSSTQTPKSVPEEPEWSAPVTLPLRPLPQEGQNQGQHCCQRLAGVQVYISRLSECCWCQVYCLTKYSSRKCLPILYSVTTLVSIFTNTLFSDHLGLVKQAISVF